jgi:hypothetical protein
MQQKTDSPTPEQQEALKHAAAFAYGYSLGISQRTNLDLYKNRAKELYKDLIAFRVIGPDGVVIPEPYFESYMDGLLKAEKLIEEKP